MEDGEPTRAEKLKALQKADWGWIDQDMFGQWVIVGLDAALEFKTENEAVDAAYDLYVCGVSVEEWCDAQSKAEYARLSPSL